MTSEPCASCGHDPNIHSGSLGCFGIAAEGDCGCLVTQAAIEARATRNAVRRFGCDGCNVKAGQECRASCPYKPLDGAA